MRRLISSKSDTCTESADVDVTDINVKVSAHYPGRSGMPMWIPEVSRSHRWRENPTICAEGLNVIERPNDLNFRHDERDAA